MFDLGDQFKFDYEKIKAEPASIFRGNNYRITVLSESLIRLEYDTDGLFVDQPTELVWNRHFITPKFEIKQDDRYLEITTKYFHLFYRKEKAFIGSAINKMNNLRVDILNSDKVWYYGHPEVRNYSTPGTNLFSDDKLKERKSLYSIDGFATIDDSNANFMNSDGTVAKKENKTIDIYLFAYLNDFNIALKDYYTLTGYPALIPRYALGNWWSKNEAYNDLSLKKLTDSFKENDIPLSVLLLDKDWHKRMYIKDNHLKTGFTFNNELFKNPAGMVNYLHSKGIRLGLSINPSEGIYSIDQNYEEMAKICPADKDLKIPFNVLDPKCLDAYLKLLIHPLDDIGVDFFFLDDIDKNQEQLFLKKHYHFYDMMRNYKRRPLVLGYNSSLASHRYPIVYSGKSEVNWQTLKMLPLFNADATNMGVSYLAHDLGGYYKGTEDSELYIRFTELGTFSPIFKFGSDFGKYYKREPWRWDIKTYTIVKNYMQLRHRLIPYLYDEAYRYYKDGTPLIEPIYYKYPELYDDELFRGEYYLGHELLVSPITGQKDSIMNRTIHRFYVPDGIWYDIVTGKKFPGGKTYVSFFREEDYPVFARAGAIIPLALTDNLNDTNPPKGLEFQIYPGKDNKFELYEDDGNSDLYKKGFYLLSSIEYNYLPSNYTVIIRSIDGKSKIVPDERNYKFTFRNTKKADDVIVYFNNDQVGYTSYVDKTDFVVEVKGVPTIGQLTVNCKGKDIEIDAVRIINEDIENILSDLPINTLMKEKIDKILFGDLEIKKKRIEIRKLKNKGLEKKYIQLFLKLLEYINEV